MDDPYLVLMVRDAATGLPRAVTLLEFLATAAAGHRVHLAVDELGRFWVRHGRAFPSADRVASEEGRQVFEAERAAGTRGSAIVQAMERSRRAAEVPVPLEGEAHADLPVVPRAAPGAELPGVDHQRP